MNKAKINYDLIVKLNLNDNIIGVSNIKITYFANIFLLILSILYFIFMSGHLALRKKENYK